MILSFYIGVNIGTGNFEIYMDVEPNTITIDSVEATVVNSSGGGNNTEASG